MDTWGFDCYTRKNIHDGEAHKFLCCAACCWQLGEASAVRLLVPAVGSCNACCKGQPAMHTFKAQDVLSHAAAVFSSGAFGFWSIEAASELQKQASKAAGAVTEEPLQVCGRRHKADEPFALGQPM